MLIQPFRVSGSNCIHVCTLHTVITHVIPVLERWKLMCCICMALVKLTSVSTTNTIIAQLIAGCKVQSGLETLIEYI